MNIIGRRVRKNFTAPSEFPQTISSAAPITGNSVKMLGVGVSPSNATTQITIIASPDAARMFLNFPGNFPAMLG